MQNELLFTNVLRERMMAKFKTDRIYDVQNSKHCSFYKQCTCVPYWEQYIYASDKKVSEDAVTRFRLGISYLYTDMNRCSGIPHTALCPLCLEEEEDEFHFLFYCPTLYDLREKYYLPHTVVNGNDEPLRIVFTAEDDNVIRSVYHSTCHSTTSIYMEWTLICS